MKMADTNTTFVTKFVFLGFSNRPKVQVLLFVAFLTCYPIHNLWEHRHHLPDQS